MPAVKPILEQWFDYPDDPMGGAVLIRHLKDGEVSAILEKVTEARTVVVKEFRQSETVIRHPGAQVALAVAAVKDWKNFVGMDKKPLPCTPKEVADFCAEDGFLAFVRDCRDKLAVIAAEREAEASKNS